MNPAIPGILVIICACLNILVFAVYFHDKLKAKVRMGRNSENFLLLVAALGPAGALSAMIVLRHKIRHAKFFLVPVFLIAHLFLFFWLWPEAAG